MKTHSGQGTELQGGVVVVTRAASNGADSVITVDIGSSGTIRGGFHH